MSTNDVIAVIMSLLLKVDSTIISYGLRPPASYTVNATGETLVLNKDFPSIKQGFYQHNGGKVGKIVIFPALSKYFPSIKMGKSLFSTRVSPATFTV